MATSRTLTTLLRQNALSLSVSTRTQTLPSILIRATSASFSTASSRFQNKGIKYDERPKAPGGTFRLSEKPGWGEQEHTLDQAGRYFLMLEMMRGMYVVLEQFFRPP